MGKKYITAVVMRECNETMLNESSKVPELATFLLYDDVLAYIKQELQINKAWD